MRVLFIQKEGVPLHHTLIASETSRRALRFYQPEKMPWGVEISVTSLGSALSLVSELRWYIRRYMTAVLFELTPGIFCSHALSRDVHYQRDVKLSERMGVAEGVRDQGREGGVDRGNGPGIGHRRLHGKVRTFRPAARGLVH